MSPELTEPKNCGCGAQDILKTTIGHGFGLFTTGTVA
jgi:hypothetical protein